ncbi:MAG: transglutaminase domain-containing protein [Chloroflexi bacterium]|mgnify:CR=1 FL=1|nr:transglutaminase domain-containing protein [Chloroflexota bacterium]
MTAISRERREPFDWLLYSVLFVAISCLPLGVITAGWVPDADRLFFPALWGSLSAVILARSALAAWPGRVLGLALGVAYSLQYATRLLPRIGVVIRDLYAAVGWAFEYVTLGYAPSSVPFADTVEHVASRAQESAAAVASWFTSVRSGGISEEVTVLWFIVSMAIWILAWHATFEMLRHGRPMASLLPLGVALVTNSAVTFQALGYVQVFVAAMLLILSFAHVERIQGIWSRFGVNSSREYRRDSLLAGTAIAALAVVLAVATPYTTYNRAVYVFWNRFGPTLESWYDSLDRAFAGRSPVQESGGPAWREMALGVLPHDVGLGSEVSNLTVMWVSTTDPPPPPPDKVEQLVATGSMDPRRLVERRYWRQRTYDVYLGSGWDTSSRQTAEFASSAQWTDTIYPSQVLTQTFSLKNVRGNIVFAVNEPITVQSEFGVVYRDQDDLVALAVNADEYTVVSRVPVPTEDDLSAAQGAYADWVAERYLALPSIPQRVRDLAQSVVEHAGATTRYDKARAIEAYLRTFPYDLNIAPPPLDQDIVDYFLFTAQRGYCDYSASAMVVMLRSVGVAARYASGYGMGTYDYILEKWVVTGQNAHAWAEVYFPGLGWIEFEPTPTELPREFSAANRSYTLPEMPQQDVQLTSRRLPWGAIGAILFLAASAGTVFLFISGRIPYRPSRLAEPRRVVWHIYSVLSRRAAWLGLYPENGQTPAEFLQVLGSALERRGAFGGMVANDVSAIGRAYVRARYGGRNDISLYDRDAAVQAYNRLRRRLFRLLLGRRTRRSLS